VRLGFFTSTKGAGLVLYRTINNGHHNPLSFVAATKTVERPYVEN